MHKLTRFPVRLTRSFVPALVTLLCSLEALAQSGGVDTLTGDARYTVPIEVPPGTAGHQPELALVYSSAVHKGGSGYLGLGWSLAGLSVIERDRKFGVPYDYDAPFNCGPSANQPCYKAAFVLDGQDLIPDPTSSPQVAGKVRYRTQRDDGRLILYAPEDDVWEIRDREGRLLVYGSDAPGDNANSRVINPLNGQTFSWHLRRVEDANGNWIDYAYAQPLDFAYSTPRSKGVAYPSSIEYAQSGETSPNRCITFQRDDLPEADFPLRPDLARWYSAGFRQEIDRRIARIDVWVGACGGTGARVRQYRLEYSQSPDSQRSLLSGVVQQNANFSVTLPPHQFDYSESARAFDEANPKTDFSNPAIGTEFALYCAGTDGSGLCRGLIDGNSDGLVDLYHWSGLNGGDGRFYLSDGDHLATADIHYWVDDGASKLLARQRFDPEGRVDKILADVSGDGFLDVLRAPGSTWHLSMGSATALGDPESSPGYGAGLEQSNVDELGLGLVTTDRVFVDVTGDGLPDRITWASGNSWSVNVNRGVDPNTHLVMLTVPSWSVPDSYGIRQALPVYYESPPSLLSDYLAFFFDLNADGLPDRVYRDEGVWLVAYGYGAGLDGGPSGAGFPLANAPTSLQISHPGECPTSSLSDVNGDGFVDLLQVQTDYSLEVRFGDGSGFPSTENADWSSAPINCAPSGSSPLIDVNGDGLVDHVYSLSNIFLNEGPVPELLVSGTGPGGGSLEYAYGASTREQATAGVPGNPNVPFPRQVVKQATLRDGRSGGSPTIVDKFSYHGGLYDRSEREFRGFAAVTATREDGTAAPQRAVRKLESTPAFERACSGQTASEEVYADTVLLRRVTNVHTAAGAGAPSWERCLLSETRVEYYEGLGDVGKRVTRSTFAYSTDGNFNLAERRDWGEVASGDPATDSPNADGRLTEYEYATPAAPGTRFLVSSPSKVTLKALGGTVVSSRQVCYDGEADQACSDVSIGRPTLVRDQRAPGDWVDSKRIDYDTHGNVLRTHDANTPATALTGGFRRTFSYDSEYAAFPIAYTEGDDSDLMTSLRTQLTYADIPASGTCAAEVDAPPPGLGLPCAILSPQGQRTDLGYDALGRTTEERYSSDLVVYRTITLPTTQSPGVTTVAELIQVDGSTTLSLLERTDGLGRMFESREPGAAGQAILTERTFDVRGRLATQTLPRFSDTTDPPRHMTYEYDALGRLARTVDFDGTTERRLGYTPLGIVDETYLDGVRARYEQRLADGLGRLVSVTEYRDATAPANPYTTSAVYDAASRLVEARDPVANYPALCSIPELAAPGQTAACAAQQHTTTIVYDTLGRRTLLDDPDAGNTIFSYDDAGMLLSETDAAGNVSTYSYDELNRPTRHLIQGPEDPSSSFSACFSYGTTAGSEDFGLLTRVLPIGLPTPIDPCPGVGPVGTEYQYEYDPESRLKLERQIQNSLKFANEYSYDALGRLKTRKYPDAEKVVYSYSGAFLSSITSDPAGNPWVSGVEHDALGRVKNYTIGSSGFTALELERTFSATSARLTGIVATTPPNGTGAETEHMSLAVSIDGLARVTALNGHVGPATNPAFPHLNEQSFSYDGLGRLRTALGAWEKPQGFSDGVTWTFDYDALGNLRKQLSSRGTAGYNRDWSYADTARPHFATHFEERVGPSNTYTDQFTPDAAGKVSVVTGSLGTRDYQWNRLGLLARRAGFFTHYRYDIFGRRSYDDAYQNHYVGSDFEYRTEAAGGGPFGTKFFLLEGQRVATRSTYYAAQSASSPNDWAGAPGGFAHEWIEPLLPPATAVGLGLVALGLFGLAPPARFRRRAVWLRVPTIGLLGSVLVLLPIQPLWAVPAGQGPEPLGAHDAPLLAYLPDHQGTTRGVVSITGALVETRGYDPFGREIAHTGDYALKHQYTGQPRDRALDLDHYGARMYSAKWARFLSPDPLVSSFNSAGLNRYAYVGNDPMSRIDPTGMQGCFDVDDAITGTGGCGEPLPPDVEDRVNNSSLGGGCPPECIPIELTGTSLVQFGGPPEPNLPRLQPVEPQPRSRDNDPGGGFAGTVIAVVLKSGKTILVDLDSVSDLEKLAKEGGKEGGEMLKALSKGEAVAGKKPTTAQRVKATRAAKFRDLKHHGPVGPKMRGFLPWLLLWDALILSLEFEENRQKQECFDCDGA